MMKEQVEFLNSLGYSATYIGRDSTEDPGILNGEFSFLFASPERLVGTNKWRQMLRTEAYSRKRLLVVVDEAHIITEW